jgi:hypothetical protein
VPVPQPNHSLAHLFVLVSELVEDAIAWVQEEAEVPSSSLRPLAQAQAQIPQPPISWAFCLSPSRAVFGPLEEA